jgi:hypothetical protein
MAWVRYWRYIPLLDALLPLRPAACFSPLLGRSSWLRSDNVLVPRDACLTHKLAQPSPGMNLPRRVADRFGLCIEATLYPLSSLPPGSPSILKWIRGTRLNPIHRLLLPVLTCVNRRCAFLSTLMVVVSTDSGDASPTRGLVVMAGGPVQAAGGGL